MVFQLWVTFLATERPPSSTQDSLSPRKCWWYSQTNQACALHVALE